MHGSKVRQTRVFFTVTLVEPVDREKSGLLGCHRSFFHIEEGKPADRVCMGGDDGAESCPDARCVKIQHNRCNAMG